MGPERVQKGSRESLKGVQRVLVEGPQSLESVKGELREGPKRVKRESRESLKGFGRESAEGPERVKRGSSLERVSREFREGPE